MLSEWPGLSYLIKSLLILLQSMREALSMVTVNLFSPGDHSDCGRVEFLVMRR